MEMATEGYREELAVSKLSEPSAFMEKKQGECSRNEFTCIFGAREKKLVCVTAGNSLLGSQIVKELLALGDHLVRVIIQNQVDLEDMRQLISDEEINQLESVLVAKMGDLDSLCNAFRGCHAIFHTSSFIDPHGVSGYSERMAFLETEGARNVIEACGRAAYVKRCIFTSSLLACIWTGDNVEKVDETCWSNEEFCRDNKLWFALGKTAAEKVAWMKSREMKVKLVTVCPALLMAPSQFPIAHQETSLPYLKGGQIMLRQGFLATGDAKKAAEAHVHVYKAMDYGASGRYLCFQRVVRTREEAIQLEHELKINDLFSGGRNEVLPDETNEEIQNIKLCNSRLARLVSQASRHVSCKQ